LPDFVDCWQGPSTSATPGCSRRQAPNRQARRRLRGTAAVRSSRGEKKKRGARIAPTRTAGARCTKTDRSPSTSTRGRLAACYACSGRIAGDAWAHPASPFASTSSRRARASPGLPPKANPILSSKEVVDDPGPRYADHAVLTLARCPAKREPRFGGDRHTFIRVSATLGRPRQGPQASSAVLAQSLAPAPASFPVLPAWAPRAWGAPGLCSAPGWTFAFSFR
jgi:hypothetical protein